MEELFEQIKRFVKRTSTVYRLESNPKEKKRIWNAAKWQLPNQGFELTEEKRNTIPTDKNYGKNFTLKPHYHKTTPLTAILRRVVKKIGKRESNKVKVKRFFPVAFRTYNKKSSETEEIHSHVQISPRYPGHGYTDEHALYLPIDYSPFASIHINQTHDGLKVIRGKLNYLPNLELNEDDFDKYLKKKNYELKKDEYATRCYKDGVEVGALHFIGGTILADFKHREHFMQILRAYTYALDPIDPEDDLPTPPNSKPPTLQLIK